MTRDRLPPEPNDLDDDVVPSPDAPAGDVELAKARSFAELVDRMVGGQTLPPAMSSDDRTLLDVATVIHAGSGRAVLDAARIDRLVESALAQAIGNRVGRSTGESAATAGELATLKAGVDGRAAAAAADKAADVIPIASRRRAVARVLPWALTAVAAAAVLFLLLSPRRGPDAPVAATAQATPLEQRSRPADSLIGRIEPERSGDARARLDTIYADRLAGYRDLLLSGRVHSAARSSTP
jgi:hypothetical protein